VWFGEGWGRHLQRGVAPTPGTLSEPRELLYEIGDIARGAVPNPARRCRGAKAWSGSGSCMLFGAGESPQASAWDSHHCA
jgi:hypothetical protein